MDAANERESEASSPNAAVRSATVQTARQRLRNIGALIASVAAVGAVIGGLAGYLNAWNAIKANVQRAAGAPPQPVEVVVSKGPTIAILPFANHTGDSALDTFADGLTQETIADLSKFSALRVIGRNVTGGYKDHAAESSDLARQLGADYVIDGDLRKAAGGTRVTVRLDNAHTGDRVWSRSFDAKPGADNFLPTQDDIAGRTAAILGGSLGVIGDAEYRRIKTKPLAELTPYECVVQGFMTVQSFLPETYLRARGCLEALVASEPTNADAWAALTFVYGQQRFLSVGLPADEAANIDKRAYLVDKALGAATKAVDLAPNDALPHIELAFAHAMRCDLDQLRAETRRAIDLNPYNASNYGFLGYWIVQLGDLDAGAAMVEKGIAMVAPDNPRWWWRPLWVRHFRRGEYQQAYEAGLKSFFEQSWISHLDMAATLAALGRMDEARTEVAKALKLNPGFTIRQADAASRASCTPVAAREQVQDFLRKAGLPE